MFRGFTSFGAKCLSSGRISDMIQKAFPLSWKEVFGVRSVFHPRIKHTHQKSVLGIRYPVSMKQFYSFGSHPPPEPVTPQACQVIEEIVTACDPGEKIFYQIDSFLMVIWHLLSGIMPGRRQKVPWRSKERGCHPRVSTNARNEFSGSREKCKIFTQS